jgi:hypothetical protein
LNFAYFNPTVFAIDTIPADIFVALKGMVDMAHTHKTLNDCGNQSLSVRGGQQIQILPNEFNLDITILKSYVESKCQEYLDNIGQINGIEELKKFQPTLVSAWTIKQNQNQYQVMHQHEAHISGNIYIDIPDLDINSDSTDSCLEFRMPTTKNPSHFVFSDFWRFKPQVMKMVVFPSYIPHTVYPWRGQGSRTILAWDVKLIAKKT